METRKLWRASTASLASNPTLTYRAEIYRRDPRGRSSIYYDGGEFAPYCVESLVDILRSEARRPHELLDVSIEFRGACSTTTLRDLARRFSDLHEPRLHVRIGAPGHPAVIVTPDLSSQPASSERATAQKSL